MRDKFDIGLECAVLREYLLDEDEALDKMQRLCAVDPSVVDSLRRIHYAILSEIVDSDYVEQGTVHVTARKLTTFLSGPDGSLDTSIIERRLHELCNSNADGLRVIEQLLLAITRWREVYHGMYKR